MAKLSLNKKLQIVAVACIAIVFAASAITLYDSQRTITEKDFPLEVDLNRSVFYVGDNVTFTATMLNRCGKDVTILSNGHQPWAIFHNINDNGPFVETSEGVYQVFKANEKITKAYEFEANEPGTYILEVRYQFLIDKAIFKNQHTNITIEVR
jgi:hypothetical protein